MKVFGSLPWCCKDCRQPSRRSGPWGPSNQSLCDRASRGKDAESHPSTRVSTYGFARRWEQLEVVFLNVSLTVRDLERENCALTN